MKAAWALCIARSISSSTVPWPLSFYPKNWRMRPSGENRQSSCEVFGSGNALGSREVKRSAVSALQHLPNGEGIPLLIQLAKTSRNPEVRKQAMSSLAQSRDQRAVVFFQRESLFCDDGTLENFVYGAHLLSTSCNA